MVLGCVACVVESNKLIYWELSLKLGIFYVSETRTLEAREIIYEEPKTVTGVILLKMPKAIEQMKYTGNYEGFSQLKLFKKYKILADKSEL